MSRQFPAADHRQVPRQQDGSANTAAKTKLLPKFLPDPCGTFGLVRGCNDCRRAGAASHHHTQRQLRDGSDGSGAVSSSPERQKAAQPPAATTSCHWHGCGWTAWSGPVQPQARSQSIILTVDAPTARLLKPSSVILFHPLPLQDEAMFCTEATSRALYLLQCKTELCYH